MLKPRRSCSPKSDHLSEVKDLHTQLDAQKQESSLEYQEEVAKVTDEVVKDAEKRSQLFDDEGLGELTGGYLPDKGFVLRSADGNFLLHPFVFLQIRAAANYRDHEAAGRGSDSEFGFEIPRAKFILDGNVFSPDTTYQFIWATSDTTGTLGLQDAWVRHHFYNTDWAIRGGQIRDPADHESFLFATKTMTPDRSIVNSVLLNGDGIVKGVTLEYNYDNPNTAQRASAGFTDGERDFDETAQSFPTNSADWGAVGRVEWKLMGDWKDYSQFTSLHDKQSLLVLGAGADYTQAGDTGAFMHIVDAQYNMPNGLSLYGAYLGRYTKNNGGLPGTNGATIGTNDAPDTYDTTVRLMGGYLIDQKWEPFARYEYLDFDGNEFPVGTSHVVNDITVGFNYYWYGHRAKFTTGISYLPDGSPISSSTPDLLITDGGTEFIFQTQFQLML